MQRNSTLHITIFPDTSPEPVKHWDFPSMLRVQNFHEKELAKKSFEHFEALYHEIDSDKSGVNLLSGFIVATNLTRLVLEEQNNVDLVYNFHHLRINEMGQFPPQKEGSHLFAVHFTTYTVNLKQYLSFLEEQLRNYNVHYEQRSITTVSQLFDNYDIIVNCATSHPGLLAADGDDKNFMKHRQTFLEMDSKYLKHFLSKSFDTTIVPFADSIYVGFHELADSNSAEPYNYTNVLNRAYELHPALKSAKVLRQWSRLYEKRQLGLRLELTTLCHPAPHSPSSCIESGGKVLLILHNYDGDDYSIATTWGRADIVSKLIFDGPIKL